MPTARPLDDRLDNLARAGTAGRVRPHALRLHATRASTRGPSTSPDDPRLSSYEGVLPGFTVGLDLTGEHAPWLEWLRDLGYDVPSRADGALATEPERPEEVGVSAFLTNRYLDWLERQDTPLVRPSELPEAPPSLRRRRPLGSRLRPRRGRLPIPPRHVRHRFHEAALGLPQAAAPTDERRLRRMRAQYYGMIGDVDAQLGRVWDALERLGQWDDTFVLCDLRPRRAARRPRA